jgi:hypothetical protein
MPWMDSALILGKFCQVSRPRNVENLTKFSICLELFFSKFSISQNLANFQYHKVEEEKIKIKILAGWPRRLED